MTENYRINIQKRQRMIYLLPVLSALMVTLMLCKASIFYLVAKRASVNIHNLVVSKVIRASMEFFDNHFMGNILNRFSEDLHYLDEKVPVLIFVAADVSDVLCNFQLTHLSVSCRSSHHDRFNYDN
jgi:ATP-binding cassette subfamily C (CFTR/MRP) protein 4